jgi:predicted chitinase
MTPTIPEGYGLDTPLRRAHFLAHFPDGADVLAFADFWRTRHLNILADKDCSECIGRKVAAHFKAPEVNPS